MKQLPILFGCVLTVSGVLCGPARAQPAPPFAAIDAGGSSTSITVPREYVIGPEDVLAITFFQEAALSAEVVVRPDGKIALPLLSDVQAAGYTPEQLAAALVKAAARYIAQPHATVIVKQINSRRVFLVGEVVKPGAFPLYEGVTVMQLIAMGGGIMEWANAKNVLVVRNEGGVERRYKCNYKDVLKGKNVEQNIQLKPGDTVIVP